MSADPTPAFRPAPVLLLAAAAVAAWLWTCLCRFPLHDWNELRLAPSLMWATGINPYPGPGAGPVTTWVYGPVPIFLQLPAALAANAVSAMAIAAIVNLLVAILPLAYALRAGGGTAEGESARAWAFLVAIAAWPAVNLIF